MAIHACVHTARQESLLQQEDTLETQLELCLSRESTGLKKGRGEQGKRGGGEGERDRETERQGETQRERERERGRGTARQTALKGECV